MEGDTTVSTLVIEKPHAKKVKLAQQIRAARKRGEESLKYDPPPFLRDSKTVV